MKEKKAATTFNVHIIGVHTGIEMMNSSNDGFSSFLLFQVRPHACYVHDDLLRSSYFSFLVVCAQLLPADSLRALLQKEREEGVCRAAIVYCD